MFKVRVQNFQSIEDLTLEVDGFTVLTGSNNVGKSAFFRALRGVFTNPPPSFVRTGCKHSTVEIWSGGNHVKWEKGKGVNCYHLTTKGGSFLFDKPGSGTPSEVCEAFGVGSVMLGDRKTWPQFADQFTGPVYLLDQQGHVLADVVASPDRMQVLGKALSKAEKGRRSAGSALKVKREDQKKLDVQVQRFAGFQEVSDQVDALSESRSLALRIQGGHGKVSLMRDALRAAEGSLKAWEGLPLCDWGPELDPEVPSLLGLTRLMRANLRNAAAALEAFQGLPPAEGEVGSLDVLLQDLIQARRLHTALKNASEVLRSLEGMQYQGPEGDTKIQKVARALQMVQGLRGALVAAEIAVARLRGLPSIFFEDASNLMATIEATRSALAEARTIRKSLQESRAQLKQIKEESKVLSEELETLKLPTEDCPLCGSSVHGGIDGHASH